jgi:hypothetical protein
MINPPGPTKYAIDRSKLMSKTRHVVRFAPAWCEKFPRKRFLEISRTKQALADKALAQTSQKGDGQCFADTHMLGAAENNVVLLVQVPVEINRQRVVPLR